MKRIEKTIVFTAIANMLIYVPVFVTCVVSKPLELPISLMTWHFGGMILNLAAIITTFRDLYRRPFSEPNDKLTWCLIILYTGGIGWLVYIFKHALKPRPEQNVCKHYSDHG